MYRIHRVLRLSKLFLSGFHQTGRQKTSVFGTFRNMTTVGDQMESPPPVQPEKIQKHRIRAIELLKKRVEEKAIRNKNLIVNSAEIVVIEENSILVSSEGKHYMFNAVEGTQRFCYLNGIKLTSLERIFITNSSWNRLSGAIGLSLTLQDVGAPSLCIHSTEGIENFFQSTEQFMTINSGMKCETKNLTEGDFDEFGIRVHSILSSNDFSNHSKLNALERDTCPDEGHASKRAKSKVNLIAYSCTFPDLPGALDPDKCRELKVPVGRLLAELKSGKDVELTDGRIVKSTEVCGPKSLGLHFIVLECPSVAHIDNLVANPELNKIRACREHHSSGDKPVGMVVHFSPRDVTDNPRYKEWMSGFPKDCKHLLTSDQDKKQIKCIQCYRFQYLMQQLDSAIFPKLYLTPELTEKTQSESSLTPEERDLFNNGIECDTADVKTINKGDFDKLGSVLEVTTMDRFGIRPKKYLEVLDPTSGLDVLYGEAKLDPHFFKELELLRDEQQKLPEPKDYEPELIFLGTGSALPSKLRNTSCILMNFNYPKKASVIMDCGEDSYGQLNRLYGPDKTKEVLRQLKLIYVSHHHADHHIGLIELLLHRSKVTKEPVVLVLPPGIEELIDYQNNNFENLKGTYKVYPTKLMKIKPTGIIQKPAIAEQLRENICYDLNGLLDDIKVVGVTHCIHSCAVSMRFKIRHPDMDTFSVSYSGDAIPSEDFVAIGKRCDLLIHEATFDHRSEQDAESKKHSTSHQAIKVGRDMQAKFTILTHFSQRLPKIPYFTEEFDDKVGFAFDNLSIRCPSHFGRLPIMKPMLKLVFKKSLADIDMKFMKRERRQQIVDELLQTNQIS